MSALNSSRSRSLSALNSARSFSLSALNSSRSFLLSARRSENSALISDLKAVLPAMKPYSNAPTTPKSPVPTTLMSVIVIACMVSRSFPMLHSGEASQPYQVTLAIATAKMSVRDGTPENWVRRDRAEQPGGRHTRLTPPQPL